MTVTGIEDIDSRRVRVVVDEDSSFVLLRGELTDLGLCEGCEIAQNVIDEVIPELLTKRAKLRAMKLLEHRDYTEQRLRSKLAEGGFPDTAIDTAVSYVQSFGYQDDRRYAEDYCRARMNNKSRNHIRAELTSRGIDRELADQVLEDIFSGEDGDAEYAQIRKFLLKKQYNPETADHTTRQKLMAALARRGFSTDIIRRAIGEMEEEM